MKLDLFGLRYGVQGFGSPGGVSGEVRFPPFIEELHDAWLSNTLPSALTTTLEDEMDIAFGNDPYTSFTFTSPTTDFAKSQTRVDEFVSATTALSQTVDFASIIDQAVLKADECDIDDEIDIRTILNRQIEMATASVEEGVVIAKALVDGTVITDLVTAFEERQSFTRAKRVSAFASGMADISEIHSSAFLMGLGSIFAQEQTDTASFDAQLSGRLFEQGVGIWIQSFLTGSRTDSTIQSVNKSARTDVVKTGLGIMHEMLQNKLVFKDTAARLQTEHNRVENVMLTEFEQGNLNLDVQSALWDLTIFGRGVGVVGGLSGYAYPLPEGPSRLQSVLGGVQEGG